MILLLLIAGWAWSQPVIQIDEKANGAVVIEGLSPELLEALSKKQPNGDVWKRMFQVYLGTEPPKSGPSMIGAVKVEETRLVFMPFFPMLQGREHVVRFRHAELAKWAEVNLRDAGDIIQIVKTKGPEDSPSTAITKIYPSAEKLPANLLKFYLHFTQPMRGEDLHTHITLIDEISGEPVKAPFLDKTMWDDDRKRATLFFHPGRIKRGLVPNQEMGLALKPGRAYVLEVKTSARDAFGQPLREKFTHKFRTGAADRKSPEPKEWLKNIPEAGSRDLMAVLFNESLDRALIDSMITLKSPEGNTVEGAITVGEDERVWVINPKRPWAAGTYQMILDPRLEDLAGNRLDRLFDMPADQAPKESKPIIVKLEIKL